jgi:hypothetical protein
MLDGLFGFYVLQLRMKRDTWMDVREFSDQAEAAEAYTAAKIIDANSVFRLVRIWR